MSDRMKKIALCLALGLLAGCATNDSVTAPATKEPVAAYYSLETLNYQPLQIYDEAIEQTIRLTDQSATLKTANSDSVVTGWKLPGYGAYRFKIRSQIKRGKFGREASAFMPQVQLLDKNYQLVKTLPATALHYQKPGLLGQEYFYHSFVVDNRDPLLPPVEYIVVNMSDDGRSHRIPVLDMEKEYAKVRGTLPPATNDVVATASDQGVITLEAMALTAAYSGSAAPEPAYTPPVSTGSEAVEADRFDTIALGKEYRETVLQLLDDGKVQEALVLRESASQMYADLQAAFAALYKRESVDHDIDSIASGSQEIDQRLSQAYQQQLMAHLQQGETRAALGVIDQSRALLSHIDALF
ncbi:MalM family protein [Endozoicomonas sp. SCSIO W0465]|uniref:MalM family protein n=1 Tax=Endozoicomonas sp. SCSIO W0465 TaxID=2918516 RepID=UPI002074EDAF|nr:MalM family protein [Endozoicomonas sp. SCSIO W0465]USE37342.1 MalM family protein [Endozoicomonas sp. SCSIO W0465]